MDVSGVGAMNSHNKREKTGELATEKKGTRFNPVRRFSLRFSRLSPRSKRPVRRPFWIRRKRRFPESVVRGLHILAGPEFFVADEPEK